MKMIPYSRQCLDKKDINQVIKVLKSDWITQGPNIATFEKSLCKYAGAKYAIAVSSGTAALHIACLAAGIKEGDEVITSPITFLATPNSVIYCGGEPVFADILPDTANIDPNEIEKKFTKKTKAIIPVHFAGHPCDLIKIHSIAKRHNLIVIEDACHALGAKYRVNNRWVTIGSCRHSDLTVFSFHPVKTITTGEGGAITTNNKNLYEKMASLRSHGIVKNRDFDPWYYEMHHLGFNYRMSDIQAALGISQLKKLKRFIEKRRQIAMLYNREFSKLKNGVDLPFIEDNKKSAWHLYVVKLKNAKDRKVIFKKLVYRNIKPQVHYIPVHLQPYYQNSFAYKKGDYPIAESYYTRCFSLPLYPSMSIKEVQKVIKAFKENVNAG